jgi:hypothetical protein
MRDEEELPSLHPSFFCLIIRSRSGYRFFLNV